MRESKLLTNFLRYAKEKIKITVKNNKIILYNDGENIDENILNNIFTASLTATTSSHKHSYED